MLHWGGHLAEKQRNGTREQHGAPMFFMVIERFRSRDPKPIYRRLRDQGRQMPDALKYVDSRIEPTFER
jgi:hypothetical protein